MHGNGDGEAGEEVHGTAESFDRGQAIHGQGQGGRNGQQAVLGRARLVESRRRAELRLDRRCDQSEMKPKGWMRCRVAASRWSLFTDESEKVSS